MIKKDFDPVIILLPIALLTSLFLGSYVEALILIGLFVPEMVIKKVRGC